MLKLYAEITCYKDNKRESDRAREGERKRGRKEASHDGHDAASSNRQSTPRTTLVKSTWLVGGGKKQRLSPPLASSLLPEKSFPKGVKYLRKPLNINALRNWLIYHRRMNREREWKRDEGREVKVLIQQGPPGYRHWIPKTATLYANCPLIFCVSRCLWIAKQKSD